ncbi:uncharacterized protein [Diadema setosum]|uniref:uncharacterized protein n=1 Tax=Diadema setosum TaxID=31175 RepID=UPI003B3ACAA6
MEAAGHMAFPNPREGVPHSHLPDVDAVTVERAQSNINQRAATELAPVPSIYRDEHVNLLLDNNQAAAASLPPFRSLASSAYRSRKKHLPPLPRELADLQLVAPWSQTATGDQFVLFDQTLPDNRNRIICFCSEEDLHQLCATNTLYMDGTFGMAPPLFMQLYTIHGFVHGKQLPLVYALLTGKTVQIYTELFRHLKNKAAELQNALNPQKIMTDFESGLRRAVMAEFPQAEHKGCFFHFCQAVHRNIKAVGLQGLYNDVGQPEVRNYARKLMATAFLPPAEVVGAVNALQMQAPVVARMDDFTDYFNRTWMAGNFPIDMWNVHREERRTNNDVEGWHNAFTRMVAKYHPNIWEFINALKKQHASVTAIRLQIEAGQVVGVRQPKYVRLNDRLQLLTARYLNGEIPQMHFLQTISHTLAATV